MFLVRNKSVRVICTQPSAGINCHLTTLGANFHKSTNNNKFNDGGSVQSPSNKTYAFYEKELASKVFGKVKGRAFYKRRKFNLDYTVLDSLQISSQDFSQKFFSGYGNCCSSRKLSISDIKQDHTIPKNLQYYLSSNNSGTGGNRASEDKSFIFKPPYESKDVSVQFSNSEVSTQPQSESKILSFSRNNYFKVPVSASIDAILNFPLFKENDSVYSIFTSCEDRNARTDFVSDSFIKVPSVSKILNDTMSASSRKVLAKYEERMIAELGEEGFREYKKNLLGNGELLHQTVHDYLVKRTEPDVNRMERIGSLWKSVQPVVSEISEAPTLAEAFVKHPYLNYTGIIDCIANYREMDRLVEFKTSTKPKPTLKSCYDNPVQLAAYLGAMQFDPACRHINVRTGLLVYCYTDGTRSDTHVLTPGLLKYFWQLWLDRLVQFWKMQSDQAP